MTFPSGPEYESYVALARELRLPFPDDEAWQRGSVFEGDPGDVFFAGEQSAEGGQWPTQEAVFVPRLDQLLAMLANERHPRITFDPRPWPPGHWLVTWETWAEKPGQCWVAMSDRAASPECPTREEAAIRLWMAATGRKVPHA